NTWIHEADFNIIGLAALANFVVTIDAAHHSVYFEPARKVHLPDPNERMIPIGLTYNDGVYSVFALTDEAAALGLKRDDQIVAIDGKPVKDMPPWQVMEAARHGEK